MSEKGFLSQAEKIESMFLGQLVSDFSYSSRCERVINESIDFTSEKYRFFYRFLIDMYKTFSKKFNKESLSTYAELSESRKYVFEKHGGFSSLEQLGFIGKALNISFESNLEMLKKMSIFREYKKAGFPMDSLFGEVRFEKLKASDITKIIRKKINDINNVTLKESESEAVNETMKQTILNLVKKPDVGLQTGWHGFNSLFRGLRKGKVLFEGMLSNEGKTRKMINLATYVTLVQNEKFLILSNEMDYDDIKNCFITTVLNNKEFQKLHKVKIYKPEKEIVEGIYRDKNNEVITRTIDDDEEWANYLLENSPEFAKVIQVMEWVEKNMTTNLLFGDVGRDYSDSTLEYEIQKHKDLYDIKYIGYDTLKGYKTDEWQPIKQTATMLKELAKDLDIFLYAVFQLTDSSENIDIFELNSQNVANSKQIKHIADFMTVSKRITRDIYDNYCIESFEDSKIKVNLNERKTYYGTKIIKNRSNNKDQLLAFEVNLDTNEWKNIGYLLKKDWSESK